MTETSGITYRDAGVDIDAGDELVERIKPLVRRAQRREGLAGIGGLGAPGGASARAASWKNSPRAPTPRWLFPPRGALRRSCPWASPPAGTTPSASIWW